jgi:enoyl-CoA hydratase
MNLDTRTEDAVLVLTLRRGAKRNAVDQALADELDAAFAAFETDPALRVAVLTGEPPCFSAGTDLSSGASPVTVAGGPYGFVRRRRTKPLIAAVEGFALGGGFEMVLACDLVVAARDATFGLPEVRRGVVANCGALFRAPDRLPHAIAMQLLLTGEPITAQRAYDVGLVNLLTESGQSLEGALEVASAVTLGSPAAIAATLTAIEEAREAAEEALWPLTAQAHARAAQSPDRAEGIAAFFERREPRWTR